MGNAAKQVTPKDRFVGCLAYKPWCGDDKSAQLVRPINLALQKAYIAPNPPAMVHWLIFDLDHDNCFIWSDKGLPEPNIIVQNPENGHCHLYYAISPVCVSENARIGPIRYMEAVARGMTLALEADESYTGRIAKNPLWPFWKTSEIHSYEYSLDELASEVTPVAKTYTYDESDVPDSRNCALFHRLRHWAYMQVNAYRESSNEDEWHKATLEKALGLSALEPDFTYNEVRNTAKSVAKWTWINYRGNGKNRGAMDLAALDINLKAKQRLSARRTHSLRANASEQRIKVAIKKLRREGTLPTKSAVAAAAGLSRQQVSRRYSHLFNDVSPTLIVKAKSTLNNDTSLVTYGVHQITARFRGVKMDYIIVVEKKDEGD